MKLFHVCDVLFKPEDVRAKLLYALNEDVQQLFESVLLVSEHFAKVIEKIVLNGELIL
jgi:hypothetical protein